MPCPPNIPSKVSYLSVLLHPTLQTAWVGGRIRGKGFLETRMCCGYWYKVLTEGAEVKNKFGGLRGGKCFALGIGKLQLRAGSERLGWRRKIIYRTVWIIYIYGIDWRLGLELKKRFAFVPAPAPALNCIEHKALQSKRGHRELEFMPNPSPLAVPSNPNSKPKTNKRRSVPSNKEHLT